MILHDNKVKLINNKPVETDEEIDRSGTLAYRILNKHHTPVFVNLNVSHF